MSSILPVEQTPKALRAGYGASDRLKKNNTAKSMICPEERPQEIYTPHPIIDAVQLVWGRIALDPCWGPGSIIEADAHYYVPPRIEVRMVKDPKTKKYVEKARTVFVASPTDTDGLWLPWVDFTFVNPPFALLKDWLAKALLESALGKEIMVLCPVRPHRKWWRTAARSTNGICYLNPVKFLGNKSALPLPMCVMYFGERSSLFKTAFEDARLGECL